MILLPATADEGVGTTLGGHVRNTLYAIRYTFGAHGLRWGVEAYMRIALAQINPTVGDLAGNLRKHLDALARARDAGATVVVFPEMSILGYPPKDLLLKPAVIALAAQAVERVAEAAPDGRRLAFEVSEQYPANWRDSMPVVLEALKETR